MSVMYYVANLTVGDQILRLFTNGFSRFRFFVFFLLSLFLVFDVFGFRGFCSWGESKNHETPKTRKTKNTKNKKRKHQCNVRIGIKDEHSAYDERLLWYYRLVAMILQMFNFFRESKLNCKRHRPSWHNDWEGQRRLHMEPSTSILHFSHTSHASFESAASHRENFDGVSIPLSFLRGFRKRGNENVIETRFKQRWRWWC